MDDTNTSLGTETSSISESSIAEDEVIEDGKYRLR